MLSSTPLYTKRENGIFFLGLVVAICFFLWSRLDFSERIYYSGDGNIVVGLIQLILQTHNWDVDWNRLVGVLELPDELKPFVIPPDLNHRAYNLSGYTLIGAVISKIIYTFGFSEIPIQKILHVFNVLIQLSNLALIYFIGKKLANRYLGLIAVFFFTAFPLALTEAHYERPEAWLCLLTTAIVYFSVEFEKNIKRNSAWIGALIGLSIVTKFSQIFLGIIPAVLFSSYLLTAKSEELKKRLTNICACGVILLLTMVIAAFINAPCIFENFSDYLISTPTFQKFYATPSFPFAEEEYGFFKQLGVIFRYFYLTLGAGWLFCFFWGVGVLPTTRNDKNNLNCTFGLVIILPIVFLTGLFALQVNFIERNFASVVGLISLLSAIGFYKFVIYMKKMCLKSTPYFMGSEVILAIILLAVVLCSSLKLDYLFVQNHIKKPSYTERIKFQNELKKDFLGFWIKNVYITLNMTNTMPEHVTNPPRIYHVEDLNEFTTRNYLLNLKNNGFIEIAEYCSDFYHLPPTDFTIYHARARNHYFIKDSQWPKELAIGYFKTNCK